MTRVRRPVATGRPSGPAIAGVRVAAAGEAAYGFQADGAGLQVGEAVSGQFGGADGDGQVGFLPADAGPVGLIEVPAADLDQGIGPPLRRRTPVFGVEGLGFGERAEGGDHHLAGFGVQVAVHPDHALPGGGDVQAAPFEGAVGVGQGAVGVGEAAPVGDRPGEQT